MIVQSVDIGEKAPPSAAPESAPDFFFYQGS